MRAYFTGGPSSTQTEFVTVIPNTGPRTAPAAPLNVMVTPGINSLAVSWDASIVTGNNNPTNYKVDWNPGGEHDNDTTTSYTIPNLTAGTTYSVRVRAENGAGGAWSVSVNGVPVSGPQVTTIDIESFNNSIATIRIYLANPDATQQTVYYCIIPTDRTCSGTEIQNTNTPSPHTSAFLIPMNLAENTTFIVSASLDAEMATNVKTARFTTLGPPDRLRLNVSPADGSLDVSWAAPTNNGGADITKYVLQWKSGAESYSSAREETADYDATADTVSNTEIAYANSVFSYTIPDLANGTAAEETATPSTVPGSAPINIAVSECNSSIYLSWEGPTNTGGNPITSYTIQWVDFDDMATPERQVVTGTPDLMYTLESLTNGTQYSIRILATNINGDASHEVTDETTMVTTTEPIWSPVEIATPREAPCVSGIKFGKILADSAPIIVEVKDAEDGTIVYMQYSTVNDKTYKLQRKTVNAGDTTVTFDVRDLQPETEYVTEVLINPGSTRFSTARAFFTTGEAPPDTTIRGGASFARILRIEPGVQNVVLKPGDRIRLDVNVYGRQGLLANDLADRAPTDGRPTFTWTSDRGGSFAEFGSNAAWRNSQADDRQVTFTAPETPGTVEIKTALLASAECQPTLDDETSDDQIERCSATFNLTVRRLSAAEPQRPAPVNPPGTIPDTLTDSEGTAYAVFTPRDGGNFVGEGYSFSAGAGAVANGEFIGISMANTGDASNTGATHQRYTLMGATYDIKVVDSSSEPVSDIVLQEPATVCLPLPNALRSNIADIAITAIGGDDSLTILATSVKITPDGVIVCAGISALPATVAVGALGAPPPPPVIEPEETEQALPDTGGTAPGSATLILIMLLGMAATTCALIARRRITKGM